MGVNTRTGHISGKCGLMHHQYMWHIPYLPAKFETHTPFLLHKRGLNTSMAAVIFLVYELYRKCNTDSIQEHLQRCGKPPDDNCIHRTGSGPWEEPAKACIVVCISCIAAVPSVISSAFDSWSSCSHQGRVLVTQKAAKLTCAHPINRLTSAMLLWHH